MSAAHTPGPWVVKGTRVYPDAPGIDCIATMQVSNMPNWDADARLISIAPELLEALVSITAVARRYLSDYDEHPEVQKADAAIAKATGAAP